MENTIETGKIERTEFEVAAHTMQLFNDSAEVFHPHFCNEKKTRIKAIVRLPDGVIREVEADIADTKNPFMRDVNSQYSMAEIEMFTHRENCLNDARQKVRARKEEDRLKAEERELLFHAKAQAMQIDEVKNCTNKDLTQRLRKSANVIEVQALATAILIEAQRIRQQQ